MKKIYYILLCCVLLTAIPTYAQVTIGEHDDPDPDAVLDLRSQFDESTGKGLAFLLPRLTLLDINLPAPLSRHVPGMVVYNEADSEGMPEGTVLPAAGYYFNDGFQWVQITDTNIAAWYDRATKIGAASNTADIYQLGPVYVGASDSIPHTQFAVLSENKGALVPRLSAQEIAAIPNNLVTDTIPDGLLVFNTSTKCYNYFRGDEEKRWLSICPESQPAAIAIETCDGCGHQGTYMAGLSLSASNYYILKIRVNEPGPYTLLVKTENGYSFERSGVFTDVGVYTVNLPGQGTPEDARIAPSYDIVSVFLNGKDVTAEMPCTLPGIEVIGPDIQYTVVCDVNDGAGLPHGTYLVDTPMTSTNYINIKVNVLIAGRVIIKTNTVNGVTFISNALDLAVGDNQSVTLYASGTPAATGLHTYRLDNLSSSEPGSCLFTIDVESTLGTFENPAASCLAILTEDSRKTDGEYWIRQSATSSSAVKTYCDMENGGYTLVWSFSEKALLDSIPSSVAGMSMHNTAGNSNAIGMNRPRNNGRSLQPTAKTDEICYYDYRLSLDAMKSIAGASYTSGNADYKANSNYRFWIAYKYNDADDYWAKDNYYILNTAGQTTYDFLRTSGGSADYTWAGPAVEGKVFGVAWSKNAGSANTTFGSDLLTGNDAALYYGHNCIYGNHWDVYTRFGTKSYTVDVLKEDGTPVSITFNRYNLQNFYGTVNGEVNANHHMGKCRTSSDEYAMSPTTCTPANTVQHNFNWSTERLAAGQYEGRVFQLWIK